MPRLLELWPKLNGDIGALYIRGVAEHRNRMSIGDLVSYQPVLLDHAMSGDSNKAQRAVFQDYVRSNGRDSVRGSAARQLIESMLTGQS